ncbi:hypothetical protein AX17_003671 [Amanita inopinata Kibby_2008]|nr:hypothetical protein AX17_003671 [Amanita inopinata Kibby_2008]
MSNSWSSSPPSSSLSSTSFSSFYTTSIASIHKSKMNAPSLTDMMLHRPMDQLYQCWQLAMNYVENHAQTLEQLRDARRRLKQELREFTTGEPSSPVSCNSYDLPISAVQNQRPHPQPYPPQQHVSKRPACFPFSVLWTLEDYQTEVTIFGPFLTPYASSPSPTHQFQTTHVAFAIRGIDGTPISISEWNPIATTALSLKRTVLLPLTPGDMLLGQCQEKHKAYYKCVYPIQWKGAVGTMEKIHPLLGYCADHWKAEYVLSWACVSKEEPEDFVNPNGGGVGGVMNGEKMQRGGCSGKRQRTMTMVADSPPPKKLAVDCHPRIALLQQSLAQVKTAAPALPSSAAERGSQPHQNTSATTTANYNRDHAQALERWQCRAKLRTFYKDELYAFACKHGVGNGKVKKRTLKKDLVDMIASAAYMNKGVADAVEGMIQDRIGRVKIHTD